MKKYYYYVNEADDGEGGRLKTVIATPTDYFDKNKCLDDGSSGKYEDLQAEMEKMGLIELQDSEFESWDMDKAESLLKDHPDFVEDPAFSAFADYDEI